MAPVVGVFARYLIRLWSVVNLRRCTLSYKWRNFFEAIFQARFPRGTF